MPLTPLCTTLCLLILGGCAGGPPAEADTAVDPDTTEGSTGDGGTVVDEDRDGWSDQEDCDDHDYTVHPEAEELCDGLDNDCDGAVDEGWDADGDGYPSVEGCGEGADCDDADPAISPGATDTPYDGVDQDCDGADLVDVDGDGFVGEDGGGNDCDDLDPDTHPGAEEVAKDGIDQDCDGVDLLDGDGDGWDDALLGGEDCEDGDPAIHPGALDLMNDGLDADCDGLDGATLELADAPVQVDGDGVHSDVMGSGIAACDLDEDGYDELLVGAPLADGYRGGVYLFDGAGSASWGQGMQGADADASFTTNGYLLGHLVLCGDVDGDGHMDLVLGRDQLTNTGSMAAYDTDLGLFLFYGDGTGWTGETSTDQADAVFSFDLGQESSVFTYSMQTWLADLDGDGKREIFSSMIRNSNPDGTDWESADQLSALWVISGGAWSGELAWEESLSSSIAFDSKNALIFATVAPDLDGDGAPELALGEGMWTPDGSYFPGQVALLSDPPAGSYAAGEVAWASVLGSADDQLGYAVAFGDLDGDGLTDGAYAAPQEEGAAGRLLVAHDLATALSGTGLLGADLATASVLGAWTDGLLGLQVLPAGDFDGDGAEDLLVTEPGGGADGAGRIWLLSGALLTDADMAAEDAALLEWRYEQAYSLSSTGQQLAVGDFDGDGQPDLVVGARTFQSGPAASGRAYILLTSAL